MPFIGTSPVAGFKTTTKQSFSGDNSTTAFTLNRASSSSTDLEVFVDNIQQEPTTAYSVSGTTLTFTEAPPTGTNNVYVVNRGGDQNGLLPPQDLGTTDYIFGDDISFNSDSAKLNFGADSEITITHVADTGLNLKHTATGDDKPIVLTLQTGETDIAADDVIGKINFQAPDEGTGTDAILVAAGIQAISEGDFSSSVNATSLQFMTGASETATAKASITSGGDVKVLTDGASIFFGADSEIELRHVADDGLILKHVGTGDGKEPSLTFQAGDNDIAADDVLGSIFFQAPDEGTGTDAILVAAGIEAVSEGDFSSSSNATSLVFKTGASEAAAEKVRITSGGNVGIGESSPDSDFVVKQSGSTFTTASQTVALFQRNSTTGHGCKVTILSGNNTSGDLNFGDAEDEDIGKISYDHSGNVMTFTTNTSERMRLSSSGRLSINATDSTTSGQANRLKVDCNNENIFGIGIESVRNSGGGGIIISNNETSGTFDHIVFKASDDDTVGSVVASDSSTTYNTSSDYRLKENVSYDFDATTRLKKLKPARFNFKKDKDNTIDGFIAHEVSDIVPNAVNGTKDAVEIYTDNDGKEQTRPVHQGIDHSKLVPLLTKALQEAISEIETLKTKVTALEGG